MTHPVTSRQREILFAIVESYIATGEPVSSGALAQTTFARSLSSATLRNEMAALAEAGLLDQPHTSAGRVPSAEAFRLYVGSLSAESGRVPTAQREALHAQIDTSLAGVAGEAALLERTTSVLAALSSGVGLAIGAAAHTDLLEHIHFSRLTRSSILAVVVTRSGLVRDRVLALDPARAQSFSAAQLEAAANFLNLHFRAWSIDSVRAELARRLDRERLAYQQMRTAHSDAEGRVAADASALWEQAVPVGVAQQRTVYVDGVVNLIGLTDLPADRDLLRQRLAALEEKQRLIDLLNAYIDARQDSVRVIFDLEQQHPGMAGLVLIAAPARGLTLPTGSSAEENTPGLVAILGPKRMDYPSAIDAVGYIAQLLHRREDAGSAPL